jgi:hypothetical protein
VTVSELAIECFFPAGSGACACVEKPEHFLGVNFRKSSGTAFNPMAAKL